MIVYIILFGTASPLELNYSEYVTVLSLMGFTTGVTLFCWIVVFTFRKNLLMIAKYSITQTGKNKDTIMIKYLHKTLNFRCS